MSDTAVSLLPSKCEAGEIGKQNLITSRVDLVRILPFMSFLVMSTEYNFTKDVPTMCATTVGGTKIFVNEEFLNSMSRKERAFVLVHEILHIFLEHVGRQMEHGYDPQLWNIAADFQINAFIKNLNDKRLEMPKMGLYEKRFEKKSADEIYHILLEENEGKGEGQEGEGDGEGEGQGNGSGQGKVLEKYGTTGQPGSSGMAPLDNIEKTPMTEATKNENRQKIAGALSQSNPEDIKNMGSGYADLLRAFEELIESTIPWQQVLREFITQSSKNRYTYDRVSRKTYYGGVVFPTMTGDNIKLAFGVDTSGSMSNRDLTEALSELHSICEEFDNWEVELLSCDTRANVMGEYNSEEGDDFSSINTDLVGGGGTDMAPMVEYVNDLEEQPSVLIIITDGYIPEDTLDNEVDEVPVIVIVTTSGNDNLELEECQVLYMKDSA